MNIAGMNENIMSYIFKFVGNKKFLFIAPVSKRWRYCYLIENNQETSVKLVSFSRIS